jgi:FkbM family methyltransferase
VLVVEPDRASADEFRRTAERYGLSHVSVVCAAAWYERTTLTMEIDPHHPATSFTAGTTDYDSTQMARFRETTVDAVSVDDLVDEAGLDHVDLVSITTNGAESEILRGMQRTLQRDRPYVCLARTEDSYAELMARLGYQLVGDDDRGFTFRYGG